MIDTGLTGWNSGHVLLAPTSTSFKHSEYMEIASYDSVTGKLSLTKPLQHYHYGAAASTGASYSGVDMRGEVYYMTRNVRIYGDETAPRGAGWGCQIATADKTFDEGTIRQGKTIIDNVEIFNCSQRDTFKAAIRFENA